MNRLAGKVAFITGAGSGIGRATAKMFAAEGAKIVIAEKNPELSASAAEEIGRAGGDAMALETDVTQEESVRSAIDKTVQRYSRLDILFNCAGGSSKDDRSVTEVDLALWNSTMELNLFGTFLACRLAIPLMVKQGGGTIVNTATWGALTGSFPKHIYTAAKGGVIALTRAIAGEHGRSGIRANVICPGSIKTARWLTNTQVSPEVAEKRRKLIENYPFSAGPPEDVASIVLFLASDESRMITGAVIPADGGRSAF